MRLLMGCDNMKLVKSDISEIDPTLYLSNADKIALSKALKICKRARELTTTSIDDDSVWADAQLAISTALDEYSRLIGLTA